MNTYWFYSAPVLVAAVLMTTPFDQVTTARASAHEPEYEAIPAPVIFQAAGPSAASIQSMVDAYRAALGGVNNGNVTGPVVNGRREINWDGGGSTATSPAPTPFDGFLLNRGARFTTPGSGFVQAPLDGIAATFNNPLYAGIFQPFSQARLFSAVGSKVTNVRFFVPGGGELPAVTTGFGAVFSDVDTDATSGLYGEKRAKRRAPTPSRMVFYGTDGDVLYVADVPASKGDDSLSFLGVLFDRARIAAVRVVAGSVAPGPNDSASRDIVMMDDFIYGEPQPADSKRDLVESLATDPTGIN